MAESAPRHGGIVMLCSPPPSGSHTSGPDRSGLFYRPLGGAQAGTNRSVEWMLDGAQHTPLVVAHPDDRLFAAYGGVPLCVAFHLTSVNQTLVDRARDVLVQLRVVHEGMYTAVSHVVWT